jgi:hypothetical protein
MMTKSEIEREFMALDECIDHLPETSPIYQTILQRMRTLWKYYERTKRMA